MKEEKGITLTSLVITIVVMLIMSGIIVVVSLNSSSRTMEVLNDTTERFNINKTETEEKINEIDSSWSHVFNKKGIENEIGDR